MIFTWNTTVPPITGSEKRKAYVYVPNAYRKNPEERYPVLYMFDGHNVFFDRDATYGKSWGMKEYLNRNRVPLIVAAVECNHHPPHGRLSEYSPFDFSDRAFGSVEGRGDIFMDWLTGTFKKEIDERYPTLPDRETTFICGSSMGGLMTLYAVTAYNHVFSRGAALSPAVSLVRGQMAEMIRHTDFAPGTVVYMDYGEREMGGRKSELRRFLETGNALAQRGVLVTSRLIPNGDHCEACWEEQIPFFMPVLFYERE